MLLSSSFYKLKYNKDYNNYTLILKTEDKKNNFFSFSVTSLEAKKIALAQNNITSNKLNIYDLFIDLLDTIDSKIDKIIVNIKNKKINSEICLIHKSKKIVLDSFLIDSLILSMKIFSPLYVEETLFKKDSKYIFIEKETFKMNSNKNLSKIEDLEKLNSSLLRLIRKEKYELAAIIRDRIKKVEKN